MTALVIVIPAWGAGYVRLAKLYTIPALLAALGRRKARFIIHTDAPHEFKFLSAVHDLETHPVPIARGGFHAAQAQAHRDALASAPEGAAVMLMNADVVVSVETFDSAEAILCGEIKVIAALGLRCLIRDDAPPIGVDARTLLAWAWANRHPINEDCVWGRGHTGTPTLLFFEKGESVTARCFHLHPIFLRKDKARSFNGTIDDDLLARYDASEIHTLCDREMAFAELSPASKRFNSAGPLSVERVARFGAHRFRPAHIEMFWRNSIRIIGDDVTDETPAAEIVAGIRERNLRPPEQPRHVVKRR